jgi:hypothetical protein
MGAAPTIEEMICQLEAAGWQAKTRVIWKSPSGKLYLGPFGAWKHMMRGEGVVRQGR